MEDKTLKCEDCGEDFDFSAKDQEFYVERGYQEPKRCKPCRDKRKADRMGGGQKEMHDATCAECGESTQVPFRPSEDRPVYCRDCYVKRG